MNYRKSIGIIVAGIILVGVSGANAQWVFVARKALGRIEQMTQPETKDKPSYDLATVVIEGDADKAYATAIKAIQKAPNLSITRQDPAKRIVDFTNGTISAGLKISQVNDTVVHILVVSAVQPDQTSATSLVLSGIVRVCKEMGVAYSIVK